MKGDLPAAAFRLSCALPVRTHERRHVVHVQGSKAPPKIIVDGVQYDSIYQASLKLKKARSTIKRLIQIGQASYV